MHKNASGSISAYAIVIAAMQKQSLSPAIFLMGANGFGKDSSCRSTGACLRWEIISVDSALV